MLWASLECTNFSRAKGGLPRDADSRTLAEHLYRYVEALKPEYIQIENVQEFMSWGDLDADGRPVSTHAGKNYVRWVAKIRSYGYNYAWRLLNAADYGAYTTRRRFFGIFAAKGMPIAFPEPTHSKAGDSGLFGGLKKWRPVREVLDFTDEGESIFGRKKPLVEATLRRIHAGLVKFVADGQETFLVKYNSLGSDGKYAAPSADEPYPTVTTQNRLGVANIRFLTKYFSGSPSGKNIPVDGPAGTVTTSDHHALVTPLPAAGGRIAFLDMQYGHPAPASTESPAGTVTTNPKHRLVTCHWIMNPQFRSAGGNVDGPCFTLIANPNKRPPYLMKNEEGDVPSLSESDSPATREIKEFMRAYGIADIKIRMLRVYELKRIMGFGDGYILKGNQKQQKKFIGNAVETHMAAALCASLCAEVNGMTMTA